MWLAFGMSDGESHHKFLAEEILMAENELHEIINCMD